MRTQQQIRYDMIAVLRRRIELTAATITALRRDDIGESLALIAKTCALDNDINALTSEHMNASFAALGFPPLTEALQVA